jgi:hypothetical protein
VLKAKVIASVGGGITPTSKARLHTARQLGLP